ncbi:hypothetical protein K491DRAFT_684141 [Lophiostoma macrostomum CBS 122681]|uniref:Uncharacterized protein n=1 Tax=Lophiostoma macrostomum CBS 122681 TaxID=1314788 RepID=A0A6A6SNK0_9PLEO|nr:hypothetical protein K491DRAFT_684141 [Lophiostoma macrostomum CBS 122681]
MNNLTNQLPGTHTEQTPNMLANDLRNLTLNAPDQDVEPKAAKDDSGAPYEKYSRWYLAQGLTLLLPSAPQLPDSGIELYDLSKFMSEEIVRRCAQRDLEHEYTPPVPPRRHPSFPYWLHKHPANEIIRKANAMAIEVLSKNRSRRSPSSVNSGDGQRRQRRRDADKKRPGPPTYPLYDEISDSDRSQGHGHPIGYVITKKGFQRVDEIDD